MLQPFVFLQKFSPLHLDLVGVPHSGVDEIESKVGPGLLLFNHCHVLAKGLLSVLQLRLQAFSFLLVHDLLVRFFVGDFTA